MSARTNLYAELWIRKMKVVLIISHPAQGTSALYIQLEQTEEEYVTVVCTVKFLVTSWDLQTYSCGKSTTLFPNYRTDVISEERF